MASSLIQRSFAGGELTPGLYARADLAKYQAALRTCRNFLVRRHGGVANRPGTKFVGEAKATTATFLKPFVFAAADQSYAIECGEQYFRFHYKGAPVVVSGVTAWSNATAYVVGDLVVNGGVNYYCKVAHTNQAPPNATYWHPLQGNIYEIPTPYSAGRFQPPAPLGWEQSGDIITITHLDEPPRELRRYSATRWVLSTITTAPTIAAPSAGLTGTPGTAGGKTFRYVVTSVAIDTYEESLASAVITVAAAADPTAAAPHVLGWTAVAGVAEYRVYADPYNNGVYGYLGTAGGNAFRDVGLAPDFSETPPLARPLFDAVNKYPAVSVTYQQRRIFAGTHNDREIVYASRIGFPSNFAIRSPLQDDDAVTFRLAAKHIHPVHHLVEVGRLVALTDSGEWMVYGDESGTLLPTVINPRQHGYVGAAHAKPVVIGNTLLFLQGRGTVLRDLRFDREVEGLSGRDLGLYAAHLFAGYTISEMAYAQVPHSIVWCVRSDGALLGLTYIPEEDVWGWHRHDTDGFFESVCVIPEGTEDAVYVVVRRTIDGATKRYIERFASREFTALADAFFVDSGLTYSGAAATSITGLSHLKGKTVKVLADGAVPSGTFTVSATGAVTLPTAATKVQVGLPITAELETLDLHVPHRDTLKRVVSMGLLIEASSRGFAVGRDASNLKTDAANAWDAAGLFTGFVEVRSPNGFTDHGRMVIRQTDPLPLTVLGLIPSLEVGG